MARALIGALAALAALLGGCSGDDPTADSPHPQSAPHVAQVRQIETASAPCRIGEPPDYYVPHSADSDLVLLGCARLGVSAKRAEFSADRERIDGSNHLCINPAYTARGYRGFYIPAICILRPSYQTFAVRQASRLQTGGYTLPGYRHVIWGTAPITTKAVIARSSDTEAPAAVFAVKGRLATGLSVSPFALFVLELPLRAACGSVVVSINPSQATRRVGPRPRLCSHR